MQILDVDVHCRNANPSLAYSEDKVPSTFGYFRNKVRFFVDVRLQDNLHGREMFL